MKVHKIGKGKRTTARTRTDRIMKVHKIGKGT